MPWGESESGGSHRYHCVHCGHRFEQAAAAFVAPPAQPSAPVAPLAAAPMAAPAPFNPYASAPNAPATNAATKRCPSCNEENSARYMFCLKCGGSLAGAESPAVAPPSALVVCSSCGQSVTPSKFCGACGATLHGAVGGGPPRIGKPMGKGLKVVGLSGFSLFWVVFALLFVSPRACSMLHSSDAEKLAIQAVSSCPAARAQIGDDVAPAWTGCSQGSYEGGCGSGHEKWSTSIAGTKGRGTLGWAAEESNGNTKLVGAWLDTGSGQIDLVACDSKGKAESGDVEMDDSSD